MYRSFSLGLTLPALIVFGIIALSATAQQTAKGVVFHDANENGARDTGESGVPEVSVSNGVDVVLTDSDGRYTIPVTDDTILFVIKPTGWRTPVNREQLPRFHYIHKPDGSPKGKFPGVAPTGPLPESIDFPLVEEDEPSTFRVIFFGDTQPRNVEEVNYIAHDVVEELIGFEGAFGVTLGDIVFDDLNVLPVLNGVIGRIGMPWYNVIGNHDLNFDTGDDRFSDETFARIYGPSYYAFNYSGVHFIVLDNIAWEGEGYHGAIGEEQLAFVRNDLAHVPQDTLVVAMMHIPLVDVVDKAALLKILNTRPNAFSISAHWHRQGHYFMSETDDHTGDHHHLVHGTVSGSWWSGHKDEWGIPHTLMRDGTPNGYSIATFSESGYTLRYKAARRPADFQMSLYAPDSISAAQAGEQEVIANIFMASSKTKVEMRLGETGPWTPMTRTEREDHYFKALKQNEKYMPPVLGRPLPDLVTSPHIWVGTLPKDTPVGTHTVYVRAVDQFAQQLEGRRIIRIE